ncbi:MAG: DNA cytosine methyltransferase [Pseudonocardiaceae bacterium]
MFCGAGGAAMGYARAGFDVVGVDIAPQPHYPFEFWQGNVLGLSFREQIDIESFDAIHASPPCQAFSPLRNMWNKREHLDLIAPARELLMASGLPYVIENVPHAPLLAPFTLCGSMFRLGTADGRAELRRHRLFESNVINPLMVPPCQHNWSAQTIAVYGHAGGYSRRTRERQAAVIGVYGGHGRDRRRRPAPQQFATAARREAMGIDWMTGAELSQAIPSAYTEWIGSRLLAALREPAA